MSLWQKRKTKRSVFIVGFIFVIGLTIQYLWPKYIARKEDNFNLDNKQLDEYLKTAKTYSLDRPGGTSLLIETSVADDIDWMRELLAEGLDVNDKRGEYAAAPLHFAAQHSAPQTIRMLLANGADIHAAAKGGSTPLDWALKSKNIPAIRLLLEAGADPDGGVADKSEQGYPPTLFAALKKTRVTFGDDDLLTVDIPAPVISETQEWNLEITSDGETTVEVDEELFKKLSAMNKSLQYLGTVSDADIAGQKTAGSQNNVDYVYFTDPQETYVALQLLLKHGADPNQPNQDGLGILRNFRFRTDIPVAKLLLEHGADPNLPDASGTIPWLTETYDSDLIRLYVQHGADPAVAWKSRSVGDNSAPPCAMYPVKATSTGSRALLLYHGLSPRSPLLEAAAGGDLDRVKSIVSQNSALINEKDCYGESALSYAAMNGNVDVLKYLINAGADLENTGFFEITPLYYAAVLNNYAAVEFLLERGAEIKSKGRNGEYALLMSLMGEDCLESAEKILSRIAKLPDVLNPALAEAISHGRVRMAEMLLGQGADLDGILYADPRDLHAPGLYTSQYRIHTGRPLVERVLLHEDLPMADFLMEYGVSFGKISDRSRAELLGSKSVQAVKLYLDNGGMLDEVEEKVYDLFTILSNMLSSNRTAVKYLFERNVIAPDTVVGSHGETLLYHMIYRGAPLSVNLLLFYGADPNYELPGTGLTPSFAAIINFHPSLFVVLLKNGTTASSQTASSQPINFANIEPYTDYISLKAYHKYTKKKP